MEGTRRGVEMAIEIFGGETIEEKQESIRGERPGELPGEEIWKRWLGEDGGWTR